MADRESARSLAQRKRQMESIITSRQSPCEGPRFMEPIKTDKVDRKMQDILGNFSNISKVMEPSSMNILLGIPKDPQTPVDKKACPSFDTPRETTPTPNGQVKGSKSGGQSSAGRSAPPKEPSGAPPSSRSGTPSAKSGPKAKDAVKHGAKQEQQLPKSRPGGSTISSQAAPSRDISPLPTAKGQSKQKGEDTKASVKKEKEPHGIRPTDAGAGGHTSKAKPSPGGESNPKSQPKKSTTPVKARPPSKADARPPATNSATKKDFKRPNGVINNHRLAQPGQEATDSPRRPEARRVKQEPAAHGQAEGAEESAPGHLSAVTKNLFGDQPDSTTERKPDIKKEKLVVPKLNIPSSLETVDDPSNQEVEKILNMMTEMKSPLTAIQNTPIKGDAHCKFHFLPSTPVTKACDQLLQVPPTVKPSVEKMKKDVKIEPCTLPEGSELSEKKPELADDLRISEDESDTEEPRTAKEESASSEQQSLRHSGKMDASRLSDSSSGSSSGESDDDSSSGNDTDSESDASSSDHESSPPPSPRQEKPSHKSYNLHDLINKKIIEGQKSPGAVIVPKQPPPSNPPANATSTAATPPALAVKETQSFPNTNQQRPTVVGGRRVEGSGGFVLGINDLTTTLTPPEDYDKGSFSKYNDNSINDFNKLSNERRTPLPKSPVRTGGSGGKQSASKRGPKKAQDKSPSVGKSKTIAQARSSLSAKDAKKEAKGAKLSKQSSKSGAEPKAEARGKSSKATPKGEKKTPPRLRTPEKKTTKKPTSKEFVSDTDSSDSEDEIERTSATKRVNGSSKAHAAALSPVHKFSARTEIKCKASSKGSRTKERHAVVAKTEREVSLATPVLDDVFLSMIGPPGVGLLNEPLLSPIKNEDPEKPALTTRPQHLPEITYKDGIPSLIVKLHLSLINRVPGQATTMTTQPCRTARTLSAEHTSSASETSSCRNETLEFDEDRPPPLVKAGKRKQEDLEEENPGKESASKKPKSDVKSSRTVFADEPEHNQLSSLPDVSNTVLDRRRPHERLSSTNSVSSLMSSQSGSSRRSDHDAQPNKRRKKSVNDSLDSSCSSNSSSSSSSSSSSGSSAAGTNYLNAPSNSAVPGAIKGHHEWGSPPPLVEERTDRSHDSMSVSNDVTCTRNGHRSVSEEWGDVGSGGGGYVRGANPHAARKNAMEQQRIGMESDESRQFTADSYLAEGKKLKREADAQSDKTVKALMYFDAVLSFIQCGNSMENDSLVSDEKASTMYYDTCDIIKFILKFKSSHLNQDAQSVDKKLAVLCHRCQGLLYMKMFKLQKASGMKLARVLGEHFKNTSKSQQAAPAPSPWSSAKCTGTPSPMSPTPSPAGSVGSVGSLGSVGSSIVVDAAGSNSLQPAALPAAKLTNGVPHIMASPASVSIPQRIASMMSTFIQNSNYGYSGLDYWDQADAMAQENIEFFHELDCEFGHLTLHSSTLDLVRYARLGLRKLQNS